MKKSRKFVPLTAGLAAAAAVIMAVFVAVQRQRPAAQVSATAAGPSSLTVVLTRLQPATFPQRVPASGNIMAWQETGIGTEASGLRLIEVRVNVGDTVRRGQPLARFAADTVEAELARRRAAVAEAEVALVDAAANARRARRLQGSGALPAQQIEQSVNAEGTARARLDSARADERAQRLRLAQATVFAPEDGVISARAATVGAVPPAGEDLFRLILGGRLEWRAEVAATDLTRLEPGQQVGITLAGGDTIEGRLRVVSPVIDIATRNGLAYVDLPHSNAARVGMFARGEFEIGSDDVMALPQGAVLQREGFSYVMRVGSDSRVLRTQVKTGRRAGDRIEIIDGLDRNERVVASGAAFLGDGDSVRVADVADTPPPAAPEPVARRGTQADEQAVR